MEKKLKELKNRLLEISDLNMAGAVLNWDQSTYMPPGGAPARGRQLALLSRIAQEKFIDPAVGKLLDDLQPHAESLPPDSDEARLIQVTRRDYERATKVPPEFLAQFYAHGSESYQVWAKARPENDFAAVQPYLEKTLDFSRQYANFFPGYEHIIDPMIEMGDYGMKAKSVQAVFAALRAELVPLVKAISAQEPADDSCLKGNFPEAGQSSFAKQVITAFGYDFERGSLDKTHHPFMTKFSLNDVRITTRFNESDLGDGIFSTFHESGHALYELNINQDFEGSPLGNGTSSGVHESSSRMWENVVGRSKPFWEFYYPRLQAVFPDQLNAVPLEVFYKAINKVQPSLIRTDADEVTYNLHVMIRFDLEMDLLEGNLDIKDLPEAWHARYESDLGLRAPDDIDGVLQDVHWYYGIIGGMFQGYTLGNIINGALFASALEAHPEIPAQFSEGQFDLLRNWLTENVYQYGSKFTTNELLERVTGGPLNIEPYINYLKTKYSDLYNL